MDKAEIRKKIAVSAAGRNNVDLVYVNTAGANDSLVFDGNSMYADKKGRLVHISRAFGEALDIIDTNADAPEVLTAFDRYADVRKALVLGLKDYAQKCGFTRAHLGLSGGIDSALVAVIAAEAFGKDRVTAFALPSRYSSEGSLRDAGELASRLGIEYRVLPIEPVFQSFLSSLEPHMDNRPPDLTEENLQARIRGLMLMSYSNKFGSMLLTTGNKSELATGYCTLYGDMCGALAVIGDLFKTEVFELCRHINREKEIIPPEIISKPPSAELRPDQRDEDSLMPYNLLDKILSYYIIDNYTLDEITEKGFKRDEVKRILSLVGKMEYKRRQAPPVIKVSSRAFGSGRRMPIARKYFEV
jgi:NAD+ synthase (glutamine-hydrolysing)